MSPYDPILRARLAIGVLILSVITGALSVAYAEELKKIDHSKTTDHDEQALEIRSSACSGLMHHSELLS